MHIERLAYIAEWLEAGAPHQGKVKGFDISCGVKADSEDSECGTICCIAGAATQFFNDFFGNILKSAIENFSQKENFGEADWGVVYEKARDLLELTDDEASMLFVPVNIGRDPKWIPHEPGGTSEWKRFNDPKLAAKVIRNFISTGIIDWSIA